jgi:hypothetical protein
MRSSADAWDSLAALQTGFLHALLGGADDVPCELTNAARLNIHRNTIFVGLTDILRGRYPVIERLVGEEFFRATTRTFIETLPPTSPVLLLYGSGFATFLETFGPAQELPYLPDVARLEWLRHVAYHAADSTTVTAGRLTEIPAERAGNLRFELHPSASIIRSPYPIVSIWDTNAHDTDVRVIGSDFVGETALIIRPALSVAVLRLEAAEHAFVSALGNGATLEEAAERAVAESAKFSFPQAFARLLAAGAFCRFWLDGAAPLRGSLCPL